MLILYYYTYCYTITIWVLLIARKIIELEKGFSSGKEGLRVDYSILLTWLPLSWTNRCTTAYARPNESILGVNVQAYVNVRQDWKISHNTVPADCCERKILFSLQTLVTWTVICEWAGQAAEQPHTGHVWLWPHYAKAGESCGGGVEIVHHKEWRQMSVMFLWLPPSTRKPNSCPTNWGEASYGRNPYTPIITWDDRGRYSLAFQFRWMRTPTRAKSFETKGGTYS